ERRQCVAQNLESLGAELGPELRHAGDVAAGPRKAVNQAGRDWITRAGDDDRYVFGRLLGGQCRRIAECDDNIHIGGLELGYKSVEALRMGIGRALHEGEVLAVDEALRGQTGKKGLAALVVESDRGAVGKQSETIDFALLCRRRERPADRCRAEKRDE